MVKKALEPTETLFWVKVPPHNCFSTTNLQTVFESSAAVALYPGHEGKVNLRWVQLYRPYAGGEASKLATPKVATHNRTQYSNAKV